MGVVRDDFRPGVLQPGVREMVDGVQAARETSLLAMQCLSRRRCGQRTAPGPPSRERGVARKPRVVVGGTYSVTTVGAVAAHLRGRYVRAYVGGGQAEASAAPHELHVLEAPQLQRAVGRHAEALGRDLRCVGWWDDDVRASLVHMKVPAYSTCGRAIATHLEMRQCATGGHGRVVQDGDRLDSVQPRRRPNHLVARHDRPVGPGYSSVSSRHLSEG